MLLVAWAATVSAQGKKWAVAAFAASASALRQTAPGTLPAPVIFYDFDGQSATNGVSATQYHGTVSGAVTYDVGYGGTGYAARFGGFNSLGHIQINNSRTIDFSQGMTLAFFMKAMDRPLMKGYGGRASGYATGQAALVAKDHDQGNAFSVELDGSQSGQGLHQEKFSIADSGAIEPPVCSLLSSADILNRWRYITVTFDPATQLMKFYVDGNFYVQQKTTAALMQSGKDFYIGKFYDAWYPFSGLIDDFQIYNLAFQEADVKANYAKASGLVASTATH